MSFGNREGGYLLLEDGARFEGEELIGPSSSLGEAVFNTSHTGYQEILTDPSYFRQIMVFTAVHIGNVGINGEDHESGSVQVVGAVVRSLSPGPHNWRADGDFTAWMRQSGTPLLVGADTRAITLHVRRHGAMRAGLFHESIAEGEALEQVLASRSMEGADLASEVTCGRPHDFDPSGLNPLWHPRLAGGEGLRVAVADFGVKRNILCELATRGCEVHVLPAVTPAERILEGGFQGVLLSNGPGDPAAVSNGIGTAKALIGKLPLFGICLGHQLIALAAGMETFKLHFGHRGANHPVRCEEDGLVKITSQNHGFAVRPDGLPDGWRITHLNLNDQTVEGIEHRELPVFSIQYHPEASPGPHEGLDYFDRFIEEMRHAAT